MTDADIVAIAAISEKGRSCRENMYLPKHICVCKFIHTHMYLCIHAHTHIFETFLTQTNQLHEKS